MRPSTGRRGEWKRRGSPMDYDARKNRYICPQGHELGTNGKWYAKKSRNTTTQVQHFKTNRCKQCPVKDQCTRNPNGRLIERSEHSHLVEANKVRIQQNPAMYKLRQQLVEHPYGTIKRQWGFDHIMTKQFIERAAADVGLILTAYNLRRLFNLLGSHLITSPMGWEKMNNLNPGKALNSILRYRMTTQFDFGQKITINYNVMCAAY